MVQRMIKNIFNNNSVLDSMLDGLKYISNTFNKLSIWVKLIMCILILFVFVSNLKKNKKRMEGYENSDVFVFHDENVKIYDDFYVNVYDILTYNQIKENYEVGEILNRTTPSTQSIILDIGSGTGHVVADLASQKLNVVGLDNSAAMIKKAKETYPDYNFKEGDALSASTFVDNSFTHILCLYFTIYYFKNKRTFFENCYTWLKPGGYLVIHLVNRDLFDPMLNAANPLIVLSPQRYAKDRITKSKLVFDDFNYNANFVLDQKNNMATFVEKFENKDTGKTFRKNEHKMYMETEEAILDIAQGVGFILQGKVDLMKAAYDYQYLYILTKPN